MIEAAVMTSRYFGAGAARRVVSKDSVIAIDVMKIFPASELAASIARIG